MENEEDVAIAKFYARLAKLKKQKRFLYKRRQKIIIANLNLIKKLNAFEALEKEIKKKRKAEKA